MSVSLAIIPPALLEDYSEDASDALDDAAEEVNSGWRFFALRHAPWDSSGYERLDYPDSMVGEILAGRLATQATSTRPMILTIAEYGDRTAERLRDMDAVAIMRPERSTQYALIYELSEPATPSHLDADGRWYWVLTATRARFIPQTGALIVTETGAALVTENGDFIVWEGAG